MSRHPRPGSHPAVSVRRMIQSLLQDAGDGGADSTGDEPTAEDLVTGIEGCDPGDTVCSWVRDVTGSDTAADVSDFLVDNVASILLIIVVAALVVGLLKRVIHRAMARLGRGAQLLRPDQPSGSPTPRERLEHEQRRLRVQKRTETLGGILVAIARVFVWGIAGMLVLGELGLNLAPLVAGAGIVGVALGFGAQKIVGDFLSGMFMIAEDQFGVGDIIDLGEASGTVERITLRTTVLRDIYGTVWHVPNGEVQRVGNMSQEWSKALLDVRVAYDTDTDAAAEVLLATANEMSHDPQWADSFLDDPELLGVEMLAADEVTIRISVRTPPAEQFKVQRELNRRFKRALDAAGIEIPFPQRTIWVRRDDDGPTTPATPANCPASAAEAALHTGQIAGEHAGDHGDAPSDVTEGP